MCGIFAILNGDSNKQLNNDVRQSFMKGKHRGPEFSILKNVMIKADFGFHRLAINGLNEESNQPLIIDDIVLICNGEIYNYKELYRLANIEPETDSDCEVIIHLYLKYGIEQTLELLDGVFAFCLLDYRLTSNTSKMYIARDPYGVRPLYIMKPKDNLSEKLKKKHNLIIAASELKSLNDIYQLEYKDSDENKYVIQQFQPGTYSYLEMVHNVRPSWTTKYEYMPYHHVAFNSCKLVQSIWEKSDTMKYLYEKIQCHLIHSVEKRCSTTDRPIACLLSGGLDSSLIAAIVNEYHIKHNLPTLETYSIGIEGSDDLLYAQKVADYLGTKHTQIVLTEQDFLNAIPNVIKDIESYDTTTVRASIGNWLIGKYISENSEAKVIFNGDGADELMGGYLYVGNAPDSIEFDKECKSLLKYIHTFDVLRSDKCISSHGLEPRTPYLDREWTQFYLSIPLNLRCILRKDSKTSYVEKKLVRTAFHKDNFLDSRNKQLLPDEILFRQKEAFSDGVSKQNRSLYTIIQEFANTFIENLIKENSFLKDCKSIKKLIKLHPNMVHINDHLLPSTREQFMYRYYFELYYPGLGYILPKFWMPKYSNTKDPSARQLECYHEKSNHITNESEN